MLQSLPSFNQNHAHGADPPPSADDPETFGGGGFDVDTAGLNLNGNRQIGEWAHSNQC